MAVISFEIPAEVESLLRGVIADLDAVGKEAMLVEFYRQGRLSHGLLAKSLGLSRYDTDGVLKRHNVTEDTVTVSELHEQLAAFAGGRPS